MKKLKCMICGMEINEKNFDFNSKAFNDQNSNENILFCPFCGVSEEYLTSDDEYDLNNIKLSPKEITILDHAAKLEVFNGDFYKKSVDLAKDEKIKNVFQALSQIEFMHAKIHSKLAGLKKIPVIADMDYTKYDNDETLLLQAKNREIHAVEYYTRYYNEISNEVVKNIFNALSDVEKGHIVLIENN